MSSFQTSATAQAQITTNATSGTNSSRSSNDLESRPVPQDIIKRMSLLQRLVGRGFGMHHHHHNYHNHRQHRQYHRFQNNNPTMTNTTTTQTNNIILDRSSSSSITHTNSSDSNITTETTDTTTAASATTTTTTMAMAMIEEVSSPSAPSNTTTTTTVRNKLLSTVPTTPNSNNDDNLALITPPIDHDIPIKKLIASSSSSSSSSMAETTTCPSSSSPPLAVLPTTTPIAAGASTTIVSKVKTSTTAVVVVVDNILQWMESEECPDDILPLILAYAGPKKTSTLSKTNTFWSSLLRDESTWRRLCEELYKWKEGDAVPVSWKKYYMYNPCVPVDYSTIHDALNSAIDTAKITMDSSSSSSAAAAASIRILIRPGRRYVLREAITIDEDSSSSVASVTIETMDYYPAIFVDETADDAAAAKKRASASSLVRHALPKSSSSKRKRMIRKIFKGCRSDDTIDGTSSSSDGHNNDDENYDHDDEDDDDTSMVLTDLRSGGGEEEEKTRIALPPPPLQATLVLRTRRHNEPLIRIRQGSCTIRNIKLKHICHGTDIWNGNAGIQIQPPIGPEDNNNNDDEDNNDSDEHAVNPTASSTINTPTVTLDRVDVTSMSGRGIVNIDGGTVNIHNSYVHDCAATGIYVGGPGSRATIGRSDVLNNGKGNTVHPRRGIPRGHSGIYLEQGYASIRNCNISQNSLTGISAISSDNARLSLEDSELVSNGTFQLEMPADGTVTHRNSSITRNNHFAAEGGLGRSRSGLF